METKKESGTTLIAFVLERDPAIILVSDRQATPSVGSPKVFQKIYELKRASDQSIGISMCGDGTHGWKLYNKLKAHMARFNDLNVEDYARKLIRIERDTPVNRRTHFFLGGFDGIQPHVFLVNKGGLLDIATTELELAQKSFWLGSGGRYAYPYYNGRFSTDMSLRQCENLKFAHL